MKPLDAQLRAFGRRTVEVGRYMNRSITQPLLLIGAGLVKFGYDFDKAATQIGTLGGASRKEIDGLKRSILDYAKSTLTPGPTKLAEALYFIRSSGFGAAEAMKVLKASNEAAMAGMGDIKTVADATTTVMNAYGHSVISAREVTDELIATVRVGKAEPSELAASIGRVVPIAKQMGVSFAQVGGNLAALTLQGLSADLAVTGLRQIFVTFTRALPTTQQALAAIGVSVATVNDSIRKQGLFPTLLALRQRIDAFNKAGGKIDVSQFEAAAKRGGTESERFAAGIAKLQKQVGTTSATLLSKLFPNVRALNAFLVLTANHGAITAKTVKQVGDAAGLTARKFQDKRLSPSGQFLEALNKLNTEATDLGLKLLPLATRLVQMALKLTKAFADLPAPVRNLIAANVGLVAAMGPLLILFGNFTRLLSTPAFLRAAGIFDKQAAAMEGMGGAATAASVQTQRASAANVAATKGMATEAKLASTATVAGADLATAAYARETGAVRILTAEQARQLQISKLATESVLYGGGINLTRQPSRTQRAAGLGGRVGTLRPGFQGPGGEGLLFTPTGAARMERDFQRTNRLTRGLGRLADATNRARGAFSRFGSALGITRLARLAGEATVLRGIIGRLGTALLLVVRLAKASAWLILIELVIELLIDFDGFSKKVYNSVNALKRFSDQLDHMTGTDKLTSGLKSAWGWLDKIEKKLPGGGKGLFERITGTDPLGPLKRAFSDLDKKYGGRGLYQHGAKVAADEQKKAAAAAKKHKDAVDGATNANKQNNAVIARAAKLLNLSKKELADILNLNKGNKSATDKAREAAQKYKDKLQQITEQLKQQRAAARQAFERAFGRVQEDIFSVFDATTDHMTDAFDAKTSKMLDAFDARTESTLAKMEVTVRAAGRTFTLQRGELTPAERELKALEKAQQIREATRSGLAAGEALQQAILIGDPTAIREAQQQLEDARTSIQQTNLGTRAEIERKAADKAFDAQETRYRRERDKLRIALGRRRDVLRNDLVAQRNLTRRHLQDELDILGYQLEQRQISIDKFNTILRKRIMPKFGVTASKGATLIGTAFGTQLTESLRSLDKTIGNHAKFLGNANETIGNAARKAANKWRKANQDMAAASKEVTTAAAKEAIAIAKAGIAAEKAAKRIEKAVKAQKDLAKAGVDQVPPGGFPGAFGVFPASVKQGLGQTTAAQLNQAAKAAGVPASLLKALIRAESGGRQFDKEGNLVTGSGGKYAGVAQISTEVAAMFGADRNKLLQNLTAGAKYLAYLKNRFKTWFNALVAYNEGEGKFAKGIRLPGAVAYANKILREVAEAVMTQAFAKTGTGAGGGGPPGTPGGAPGTKVGASPASRVAYAALRAPGSASGGFHLQGERHPYDCSAFAQAVFKRAGYDNIGSTTYQQIHAGRKVPYRYWYTVQPDDLLLLDVKADTQPSPNHVGIYVGSGKMIHDHGGGATSGVGIMTVPWHADWARVVAVRCLNKSHVHFAQGAGGGTLPTPRTTAGAGGGGGGGAGGGGRGGIGGAMRRTLAIGAGYAGAAGAGGSGGGRRRQQVTLPRPDAVTRRVLAAAQPGLGPEGGGRTFYKEPRYRGRIPGLPGFIQNAARAELKRFAALMMIQDKNAMRLLAGKKVSAADIKAALPPLIGSRLTAAQKMQLGPEGVSRYQQILAGIVSAPFQYGLLRQRPEAPPVYGPAFYGPNARNVTINIYGITNPKAVAAEVQRQLNLKANRNVKTKRGRNPNANIGAA